MRAPAQTPEVETVVVHGHRRAFVRMGSGPALLLLHGMGCDHTTWSPVLARLSEDFTVVAPDLLGHGASAKPRADYSVAGYANGMRDLLTVLDIDAVTVVGHSLGGGVAMQFAYQFPERTERLCLVAPGGMGPEVSMLLRALTVPGSGVALAALSAPPLRRLGHLLLDAGSRTGVPRLRDAGELAAVYDHLADPATRAALRHVVRGVIDWRGQIITMTDRAYLAEHMPLCVVWGADDTVIPVQHAAIALACAPGARVEVIPEAGHFPHKNHPERFAATLADFVHDTAPASYDRDRWRRILRRGADAGAMDPSEVGAPAR